MTHMEASDAFGTEIEGGEDPFDGGFDWSGFGEEAAAESGAPTAEPPVVDREGQRIEPENEGGAPGGQPSPLQGGTDQRTDLERAEDAYQYKTARGEPVSEELRAAHDAYVAERASAEDPVAQEAAPAAQEAAPAPETVAATSEVRATAPDGAEAAQVAASAPGEASAETEDVPGAAAAAEAPAEPETPVPAEPDPTPTGAEPEPTPTGAEPEPTPTGAGGPTGSTTEEQRAASKEARRYYVLHMVSPGKFEQVSWWEVDGKMVARSTPGAKRQGVALARSSEDALKIAHVALGSPKERIVLVAVAALHFQPKPVEPDVPPPSRTRLKIG